MTSFEIPAYVIHILVFETFFLKMSNQIWRKTQGVDKITRTPHSEVQPCKITPQNRTSKMTLNI